MHKKIYNQAKFTFNIVPVTPLLIKCQEGADPTRPSMEFIRSNNRVFIPGSSIKGVFRSYSEKILKTLELRCCNIFEDNNNVDDESCSFRMGGIYWYKITDKTIKELKDKIDTDKLKSLLKIEFLEEDLKKTLFDKFKSGEIDMILDKTRIKGLNPSQGDKIYKNCCYACRTFGCLEISSHTTFVDAYSEKEPKLEERPGIAIDRILGSVKRGALYSLEVVPGSSNREDLKTEFKTEIFMKNFQLWQLGLIGLVLRDLNDGYVQIGFAKSRGLGRVAIEKLNIELIYYGKPSNGTLKGIGTLCTPDEVNIYDFLNKDEVNLSSTGKLETDGLRWKYIFSSPEEIKNLFDSVISIPWKNFIGTGGKK
jgi:CRISPR/Cas system CSM-associated protein Csm3 (group 7 of RAMP superfamily)